VRIAVGAGAGENVNGRGIRLGESLNNALQRLPINARDRLHRA